MKERLIIILVAVISGLLITGAGFLIYQSTLKVNDKPANANVAISTTPIQGESGVFVKVSEPSDESLTNKRTLVVKGVTNPENVVVISTNLEDVQVKPSSEGNFSVSVDIDAGANPVITRVMSPEGESAQDTRSVTYSTEEF